MTTFQPLYKKTSTGAIQCWNIEVVGNDIVTTFGQIDGKQQTTTDTIHEGKNIGKVNETTPETQAAAEAQARWEKQIKKGYVENLERAQQGETDIKGGVNPMLAHVFADHGHKIKYPCCVQPKFDGIRCVGVVKDGVCTLWSRTRKPITSCPHIQSELERLFPNTNVVLDGELYVHETENFEKIVSLVRQEVPAEGHEIVEYHVYDQICEDTFGCRWKSLQTMIGGGSNKVKLAQTEIADSETLLYDWMEKFIQQGYEGAIARNADGLYVGKRSYDLQKLKKFLDDDFEIIGVREGRGKLMGHAATFVCLTKDGQEFEAKMTGELAKLKEYWEQHDIWTGKLLTVKYQELTAYGIPRFPVGLRLVDKT